MAKIIINTVTNETASPSGDEDIRKWGSWHIEITAGLDEDPRVIIEEAAERVLSFIQALPAKKRYPRFTHSCT